MSDRKGFNTPCEANTSIKLATGNDKAAETPDKTKPEDKMKEDNVEQQKESKLKEGEKYAEKDCLGMQVIQNALQEGDPDDDSASFE